MMDEPTLKARRAAAQARMQSALAACEAVRLSHHDTPQEQGSRNLYAQLRFEQARQEVDFLALAGAFHAVAERFITEPQLDYRAHPAAPSRDTFAFTVRGGGIVTVAPGDIRMDSEAATNPAALIAVMHYAKEHSQGELDIFGNDAFKARAWAYAQMHGVTVTNYQPTREARAMLKALQREEAAPERPRAAQPIRQADLALA